MSRVSRTNIPYINTGTTGSPTWLRIAKSTLFNLAMNAVTEDNDYISQAVKTTDIISYSPSLPQNMSILPGEPDYEYLIEMYHNRPTGADAHREILLVYYAEVTGSDYVAEKSDAVIKFNNYNGETGKLEFEIMLAGDIVNGTVAYTLDVPSFSPSA